MRGHDYVTRRIDASSPARYVFPSNQPGASMPRHLVLSLLALAAAVPAAAQQSPAPRAKRSLDVSALPALNFDADEGLGYGAIAALYDYGGGTVPYRYTLQPTVFLTTQGRRDLTIFLDAPALLPGHWRLSGFAGREQQLATPYYGVGNATAYDASIEHGSTRYYYRYGHDRLRTSADFQHAIGRPAARLILGAGASREVIDLTPFDSGTTLVQGQWAGRAPPTGHINYLR